MKSKQYCRMALIAAISLSLTPGLVLAKAKSTNEDESSVYNWGPWDKMITPAAGPPMPEPIVQLPEGIDGRQYQAVSVSEISKPSPPPEPPVPPVTPEEPEPEPPIGPQARSYATYGGEGATYTEEQSAYYWYGHVPASMELDLEFTELNGDEDGTTLEKDAGNGMGVAGQFHVAPWEASDNYPPRDSVPMDEVYSYASNPDWGTSFNIGGQETSSADGAESSHYSRIWNGYQAPAQVGDITFGYWYDDLENYNSDAGWSGEWSGGEFIVGMTPGMELMNTLAANKVEATYRGFSMNSIYNYIPTPVEILVNFNTATWQGSWNNGSDGDVWVSTDSTGAVRVYGQVGFYASGVINGVDIASNKLWADDAEKVTGSVVGSFFGNNAEMLGGLVDIYKAYLYQSDGLTKEASEYADARYVDLYITDKDGRFDPGQQRSYATYERQVGEDWYGPVPAGIEPDLTIDPYADGAEATGSFGVTAAAGEAAQYTPVDSIAMTEGWADYYNYYYGWSDFETGGKEVDGKVLVSSINGQIFYPWYGDIIQGEWINYAASPDSYDGAEGHFISGTTTPGLVMQVLAIQGVQATYEGQTLAYGTPVEIEVDFGKATWQGSWNYGADGKVFAVVDANNVTYLVGNVGFNASGVINGVDITSTAISATDGNVSGMVNGSFFGGQARVLGGITDVTKSRTDESYTKGRQVEVFVTQGNPGVDY